MILQADFQEINKLEPYNIVRISEVAVFVNQHIAKKLQDSGPILQNQRFHKKNTQSRSLHFNSTNGLLTVSEISCTTF